MDQLDQLPPDQSAVLSLLLRQGRSYAEIADMLGIPQSAVRDRAHAALDAIAGGPAKPSSSPSRPSPSLSPPPSPRPAGSRRAGALLLAAIVAVVVVAVILIAGSGGGGSHNSATAGSTTTAGSAKTSTAGSGPHLDKQLNLTSPSHGGNAVGLVEVLSEGTKRAFLVNAEHLAPTTTGFFYAAWLYNSPGEAQVLGRAPPVSSNGRLQAVGALPSSAGNYHQMLITRETGAHPKHPGPIVLSGAFSLH